MPQNNPSASIETPCVGICSVDPLSSLSIGCGRSLREIGAWSGLSPDMRRAVMDQLPARLARLKAERPDAFAPDGPDDRGPDDDDALR